MPLTPGSSFGPYRIVEPLGRGGMASVYKAYEAGLDRYVALKVLPAEFLHDPDFAERFKREAKVIARLEHPRIVPIHAFGIDEGIPWMAMRLVAGGALSSLLSQGRLEHRRAVAILGEAAEALEHAHEQGVLHRDVKPQNILLDEKGHVYLADFGIAKMVEGSTVMTKTGMITGTPQYMSPEQAQAKKLDHRTDIYALGIIAFEMLTGRVPFSADTPVAVLLKHVSEPIPIPAEFDVPEPLTRAVLKCLAKDPSDRWESATGLVKALEQGLGDAPIPAAPTEPTAAAPMATVAPSVTTPPAAGPAVASTPARGASPGKKLPPRRERPGGRPRPPQAPSPTPTDAGPSQRRVPWWGAALGVAVAVGVTIGILNRVRDTGPAPTTASVSTLQSEAEPTRARTPDSMPTTVAATPSTSPTASPTPTPSPTPTLSPTPTPSTTPAPTPSPTPTSTPTSTPTPVPTPTPRPRPTPIPTTIRSQPYECMIEGKYPLIDAIVQPAAEIILVRLYFTAASSEKWYFTEAELLPNKTFRLWMPRPRREAKAVTYYLEAVSTDFGLAQTAEVQAIVVENEIDCGARAIAPTTSKRPKGQLVFDKVQDKPEKSPAGFRW